MAPDDVTAGVFVGVDSGGTRTNVTIVERRPDAEQRERRYEVAEALSGALPRSKLPATVRKVLAPLEARVGGSNAGPPIWIWISAAGYTPWMRDGYVSVLHDVVPTLLDGRIRHVGVGNDAVSLLLGSRADGIVIAGTGSNVIVRTPSGELYQAGGHEWVACDYGSGFWIGLKAIRCAYRDFDAGIDSVLLQRMRQLYGVDSDDDDELIEKMRRLAVGRKDMKRDIARFAAEVCAAAERGDEDAQDIVKREAEDLADVTAAALRRKFDQATLARGLRLVQCGSVLGNAFYRASFEAQLEMRLSMGGDRVASFDWQSVTTGSHAAVQLAQDLAADPKRYLDLTLPFRPAVVAR